MDSRSAPLIIGSRVNFRDRRQGTLKAIEVDESWEVLNVVVSRGLLRWTSSVKLPFSAALAWSDGEISMDCTSAQAFGREVPPVALAARPLSAATPMALAGETLVGALVEPAQRRATELLIRHEFGQCRVPVEGAAFEGKTIRLAVQPDAMPAYRSDVDLVRLVQAALNADRFLIADGRRGLAVAVSGGEVHLQGNVRSRRARLLAGWAASAVPGVVGVQNDIVDDAQLEIAIGRAVNAAGLQSVAAVYGRSTLGEVVIFGHAPSDATAAEAVRTVSHVRGVRSVTARLVADASSKAA